LETAVKAAVDSIFAVYDIVQALPLLV